MTSKCFFSGGEKPVKDLELGARLEVVCPSGTMLPEFSVPKFAAAQLTLKEAVGRQVALSNTSLASEDSFLVLNGTVWCSLSAHSYFASGIEGQKCKKTGKYLVAARVGDLGKRFKLYLDKSDEQIEFWVPEGETCFERTTFRALQPPCEVPEDREEFQDWANAFYEWVGLCAIESPLVQAGHEPNPIFCNYFPYPGSQEANLQRFTVEGVVTPHVVEAVVSQLDSWYVLTVRGHGNSPRAFGKWHNPNQGGEFGYSLFRDPSGNVHSFKLISWGDLG